MWRVIDMGDEDQGDDEDYSRELEEICALAIDRSQGQLIDVNIGYFATDGLLRSIWQTYVF